MKIILTVFLLLLLIPATTFAAWWNPFSWFKKTKQINIPIEQTASTLSPMSQIVTEPITKPTVKNPVKSVNATQTTQPSKTKEITTPTSIEKVPSLDIINVDIDTTDTTARISWETTIIAESKVLLDGESYISNRGVGLKHLVEIDNLESNIPYGGVITAIVNNAWKSKNFNFQTDQQALTVTDFKHNCSADSCTIEWETNHNSNSRIVITQTKTSKAIKSLNSLNSNSRNHKIKTSLPEGGTYTIKIYATNNEDSTEFTTGFTLVKPCGTMCA